MLFLGWRVFPLVLLYWLENVVVGGLNVAKLLFAQPREPAYWAGKLFLVPFFVVHFSMFTYVHGVLLVALLGPKGTQPFDILGTVPPASRVVVLHLTVLFGGWIMLALGSPERRKFAASLSP